MSNFTKLKLCHTLGISQNTHFWVKGALTALLLVLCGNVAKAQSDLTFKEGIRYSQWVIESRLGDFYGNRKKFGFTTYDRNLKTKNTVSTWYKEDGKTNYPIQVDYVAGLVAKATIEAAEYYQKFDWSKPWFKSVEWYGNKCTVPTSPDNLDAINASKMYFGIYNLANGTFKSDAESGTTSKATTQLGNALTALGNYNKPDGTGGYAFPANTTVTRDGKSISLDGGWFHKESYLNEMWLDGQYMGPATLAQLIKGYSSYKALSSNDWELITKQFSIVWQMCWDDTEKLLYHAFCSEARSKTWAANAEIWTNAKTSTSSWKGMTAAGHSAAFWGRAEGWYFLALVDVLEQMQKAGLDSESVSNHDCYKTLKGYLDQLAAGIMAKQDKTSGCWYQLIAMPGDYSASYYGGKTYSAKSNYLESSCTAIFTAAYLKAIRLGLLDKTTYEDTAKRAYQGMIEQFMKQRTDGTVDLLGCCKSAGLGTNTDFSNDKFRDGSNAYYLLGADVPQTSSSNQSDYYTEGKVLGAFILAATEYEREYQKSMPMLLSKDLNSTYTLSSNESLSAEVLGDGTPTYKWYDANTSNPIEGATNASYTPTKSGKYYCVITVTPTSAGAKIRAASTEPYTITTSTADVTVSEVTPPSESANAVVWTFTNSTLTSGTLGKENNEVKFTSTDGSSTVMTYVSGSSDAIVSSSKTINDVTYSSYLKENGTGSVDGKRRMEFNAPSSKGTLTIVYAGTAGTTKVIDGSNGNKELATLTGKTNTAVTTDVLTTTVGNKIIIYCPDKSYIYSVIWTPINETSGGETTEYTVTLNATDVTGYPQTMTYSGTALKLPTPEKTGYTFDGWYTKAEGGDKVNNPYTPTTDTPLYAHWNINSYTVTTTAVNGKISIVDGEGYSVTSPAEVPYGTKLVFTATPNLGYELSSWTVNGTTVAANGATYTISSLTEATSVTANFTETSSGGGGTATYSYKVEKASIAGPKINTSLYITDNSNKKLVKMTFGGWKWEGYANKDATEKTLGSYKVVRGDKTTYYTDKWNDSGTKASDIASIDGHYYWWNGQNDAVDESKALTGKIYGKPRYGWFVSPTRDASGKTTESHPFTLPVRGSFMTFEPTMNGTLSIYILQNGAWNTDKSGTYTDTDGEGTINYSKGQIAAGEFRPHAFHVVNQRGLTVQEFSPKYSVETKQKVNLDYYCMFEGDKGFDKTKYDSPYNVARWTEFKDYMSTAEQQKCHDNWKNGVGGAQTITELDNGSFLAIEKGIVKYTFHVTKNETYYFFSNFSKMGFSGARFTPDEAQPEETVTGKISTLKLSDVTAYDKITATEKETTIEGTTLKDYTYSINGKDIAPVAGVTIPQFYSIKLTRTFTKDRWTTLTLPFNLTQDEVQKIFGAGTQIIMLDKATLENGGAHLHFFYHEIQNVLPGYPYLIKPTLTNIKNDANVEVIKDNNTITSFTVFGKCINPFINQFEVNTTPYTFKGTPGYCTANVTKQNSDTKYSVKYEQNDIFVSDGDGKLYVSGGSSYGKGYRAWLQKRGTTPVKSISVVMSSFSDDDDTTTSIDVAEMAPDLIEALGIQTGVYNLSGQRVANDTRNLKAGIYIVNGKKTVVR